MNIPIELVNKILTFRPRHPTACLIHELAQKMTQFYDGSAPIEVFFYCLDISMFNQFIAFDGEDSDEEVDEMLESLIRVL